ncbi:hypothetical protein U1Q18_029729 [Sarracenia purpurea var. burkii]
MFCLYWYCSANLLQRVAITEGCYALPKACVDHHCSLHRLLTDQQCDPLAWLCCSALDSSVAMLLCWSTLGLGAKSSQFKRKKGVLLVSSVVCRFGLVLEIVAIVLEIVDIVWAAIGLGYYCFGYCCRAAIILDIAGMMLVFFWCVNVSFAVGSLFGVLCYHGFG